MKRAGTHHRFAMRTLLWTFILLVFVDTVSLYAQKKETGKKSSDKPFSEVLQSWKTLFKGIVSIFEAVKDKKKLDAELKKLAELDKQLARLEGKPVTRDRNKEKKLHIYPETPSMGAVIESNWEHQKAVLRIQLAFSNLAGKSVDVKADEIQLLADGKKVVPFRLKSNQYFYSGGGWTQSNPDDVKKELKILPQKTGTIELRYSGFSMKTKIPQFRLIVKYRRDGKTKTKEFDLNRIEKARVKISSESIGPKNCLALVTISGKLSCINVEHLIAELKKFEERQTKRYIVRFAKNAKKMESYVDAWLTNSVQSRGNLAEYGSCDQLPTLTGSSHHFYLAAVPQGIMDNVQSSMLMHLTHRYSQQESFVLKSLDAAIEKALKPVYRNLPYNKLLKEIESGHELCRPIALKLEGERLHDDQLPYVLKLSRDEKHQKLRHSAILVLAGFDRQSSRTRLLEILALDDRKMTSITVKAMDSSRFSNVRYDLMEYFRSASGERKNAIIKELVKHPHPLWAEMIYRHLTTDEKSLSVEGIEALSAMGHPKLVEVFRQAFERNDAALEKAVCEQLIARTDIANKQLIADFIRRQVAAGKITDRTISLATHTNDQQIVPVLVARLKNSKKDRSKVISTLGTIGDQTVAAHIKKLYPSLSDKEKASALQAFTQLQTANIRELAGDALISSNRSLYAAASQILVEDGSDEAISFLVQALKNKKSKKAWPTICSSLGNIFTKESKDVLLAARASSDKETRQAARQAIVSHYANSPAYDLIYLGYEYVQQKKWKQAKRIFSAAIKSDPQLPISYLGRAQVYLNLKKLKEARKDYEKSFELDPYSSQSLIGLCRLEIEERKIENAVSLLEKNAKKFEGDSQFHYEAARIYARSLASLDKTKDKKTKESRSKAYRKKVFSNLKKLKDDALYLSTSIDKEKDFQVLKDDEEFKRVIKNIQVVEGPSLRMRMMGIWIN